MNNLNIYGWNDSLENQKQESQFSHFAHARVTVVHKTCYEVISEEGSFRCELLGNLLYTSSKEELPCTGDWVLFQPMNDTEGLIYEVLPRTGVISRKKSGKRTEKQIFASHVDVALVVQSVDDNLNIRRTERFMAQIMEQGIQPILLFTKSDLIAEKTAVLAEMSSLLQRTPYVFTSILTGEGIEELRKIIPFGQSAVLIGSSGVGKSSLVNALIGAENLATSEISESTGKGRHTSVRREIIELNNQAVLIDTPGVREFGITAFSSESAAELFSLEEAVKECKYADCTHTSEPGCAVLQALADGMIDEPAYESFLKLQREAWHYQAMEHEKRQKGKDLGRLIKDMKTKHHKYK
ncbi:MAG: ribosome small subunit-dependent GTPase A [Mangrovibacterium sp.]